MHGHRKYLDFHLAPRGLMQLYKGSYGPIIQHIDVQELNKPTGVGAHLKLGTPLRVHSAAAQAEDTYDDLDELIARFAEPYISSFKALVKHRWACLPQISSSCQDKVIRDRGRFMATHVVKLFRWQETLLHAMSHAVRLGIKADTCTTIHPHLGICWVYSCRAHVCGSVCTCRKCCCAIVAECLDLNVAIVGLRLC